VRHAFDHVQHGLRPDGTVGADHIRTRPVQPFHHRFCGEAKSGDAVVIKVVRRNAPAERLALRPGQALLLFAGKPVRTLADFNQIRAETSGDQPLVVEDKEGMRREIALPPGPVGMMLQADYRPDLGYLRGVGRSPRWDDLVLVALANQTIDPDLAETAWQRALQAGYVRDALADASGAALAYAQLRPAEAFAFGASALQRKPDPALRVEAEMTMIESARIGAKPQSALEVIQGGACRSRAEWLEEQMHMLIPRYEAIPKTQRDVSSLVDLAQSARHADLLGRLKSLPKGEEFLASLQKKDDIRFSMSPGVFAAYYSELPDGTREFDLEVTYRAQALRVQTESIPPFFLIGVGDRKAKTTGNWMRSEAPGGLLAFLQGRAQAQVCEAFKPLMESEVCQPFAAANEGQHTVRLIRFAGRHEVLFDGRRAFFGVQAYEPGDLFFFVKYSGMEIHIRTLRFDEVGRP